MATLKYKNPATSAWETLDALPAIGQAVEITATELAGKSTTDRAAMYAAGTRLLKVINSDTEVLLGLDADGSTEWLGSNKPLRNLLDNSDFRKPVNQRGQSSYTGTGYGVDRWYGIDYTISISDENIELNKSGSGSGYLLQYLVPETLQYEKSYTMAINLANGITLCGNAAYSESTNQMLFLLKDNIALSIDKLTSQSKLQVVITLIQGNLLIKSAALYEGSYTADTLPPYTPKGYAAELAECQRYYVKLKNSRSGYQPFATGVGNSVNQGVFNIQTPVQMRSLPTISYDKLRIVGKGSDYVPVKSITPVDIVGSSTTTLVTVDSPASIQNAEVYQISGNAVGSIELSADL